MVDEMCKEICRYNKKEDENSGKILRNSGKFWKILKNSEKS